MRKKIFLSLFLMTYCMAPCVSKRGHCMAFCDSDCRFLAMWYFLFKHIKCGYEGYFDWDRLVGIVCFPCYFKVHVLISFLYQVMFFHKMIETQGPFQLINSCLIYAKHRLCFLYRYRSKSDYIWSFYICKTDMFVDTCTGTGRNTHITIIHICVSWQRWVLVPSSVNWTGKRGNGGHVPTTKKEKKNGQYSPKILIYWLKEETIYTFYTDVLDIAQVYQLLLLMGSMILVNMKQCIKSWQCGTLNFSQKHENFERPDVQSDHLLVLNTVFGKFDHASVMFYCQSEWKGYFGCGMALYLLADNGKKRHNFFILGVCFKTISKPLGNFTENAIISNFHNLISNQIQKF